MDAFGSGEGAPLLLGQPDGERDNDDAQRLPALRINPHKEVVFNVQPLGSTVRDTLGRMMSMSSASGSYCQSACGKAAIIRSTFSCDGPLYAHSSRSHRNSSRRATRREGKTVETKPVTWPVAASGSHLTTTFRTLPAYWPCVRPKPTCRTTCAAGLPSSRVLAVDWASS